MKENIFYILAIDGGGIRGVFPAHILSCVEKRLNVKLLDHFQMIAGTSTGSIIASAVACNVDLETVVLLYKEHGNQIFTQRKIWLPKQLKGFFQSTYHKKSLATILTEIFGEITLGQVSIPLLIPATDIGNGGVHVFKSGYSKEFTRDTNVLLRDAILASCSAPTFFDPTTVMAYLLADGGLWANNPSLAAVIDARKRLSIQMDNIKILSIGTGHPKICYGVKSDRNWGFLNGWKNREFINFVMSLQALSTDNYLKLSLNENQIMRLNFESDGLLPLDDCSEVDNMISNADKEFTYKSQKIREFLELN